MRLDIYHHIVPSSDLNDRLAALSRKLDRILTNQETIMATLEDLKAAVARETDAEQSVITLLQGISQQLKDAKAANDPAAIDAVIAQIDANTAKLGAAVVENTSAA